MIILHDPQCADFGSSLRPEQPARMQQVVPHLRAAHPAWEWRLPVAAAEEVLLLAHTPAHLQRRSRLRGISARIRSSTTICRFRRECARAGRDASRTDSP